MQARMRNPKMKIFIIDTIVQPQGSGWTTHKWEHVRNLSRLDYEIHTITYDGMNLNGVFQHSMKAKEKYKFSFIFKIIHLKTILKIISAYNFDILYTRNLSFGLLGLLMKKIIKSKLVYELNGLFSEDWKMEKEPYVEKRVLKNIMKIMTAFCSHAEIFVAKKADAVIVVASGIKDILIEKGIEKNKITVISNGANIDLFKPNDNHVALNEIRHRWGIEKNDHVIVFVGHFSRAHGIDYLIESAPAILKVNPNTKFLIVGESYLKNEYINLAEKKGVLDKFIFTGAIPYETIPLYINVSDICVAPEKKTPTGVSPVKVYEYLACGKPVVASNLRDIGDLLKNSNSGISVTPEDPNELANAIIKLLKDEKLRKQMGSNGRELVVNNYSWEITSRKTAGLFEKIKK